MECLRVCVQTARSWSHEPIGAVEFIAGGLRLFRILMKREFPSNHMRLDVLRNLQKWLDGIVAGSTADKHNEQLTFGLIRALLLGNRGRMGNGGANEKRKGSQ